MINLYKILGVKKTDNKATIKKAYRNLSKIHHPDVGGNKEKFDILNKAYKILINPAKKARYDKGEDVENILKSENNSKEISIIATIFYSVIENNDPENVNIIKKIIELIKVNIDTIEKKVYKFNQELKKYKIFLKKVKHKHKHKHKHKNLMVLIVDGQVAEKKKNIDLLNKEKINFEKALKLLKDFDYDVKEMKFVFNNIDINTTTML